jgi:hypothetical protein
MMLGVCGDEIMGVGLLVGVGVPESRDRPRAFQGSSRSRALTAVIGSAVSGRRSPQRQTDTSARDSLG